MAAPSLSDNAIERMFAGEVVAEAVLQVLESKLAKHRGLDCLSLILSDGNYFNHFYLVPPINRVYASNPLESNSYVRLQQYRRLVTEPPGGGRKVSFEIDAMDIATGLPLGPRIGFPQQYAAIFPPGLILRTNILVERVPLTKDALSRIMAGKAIERPVVQIWSAKLVQLSGSARMILRVCDGRQTERVSFSAELTQRLVPMLGELKLSIVQVDKYTLADKRLEIGAVTWLNFGFDVCFETRLLPHRAVLTEGCIDTVVFNGGWWRDPIVQILNIRTVQNVSEHKTRVRLLISDARNATVAFLSTQLAQRLGRALTKNCIVRLDTYKTNHVSPNERSSITVFALTLLNHGWRVDFDWSLEPEIPTLSDDFISRLFVGEHLLRPVVKIVRAYSVFNGSTHKSHIRLLIYDGSVTCAATLPSTMNHLQNVMAELPIVRLDKYCTHDKNDNECLLVIEELTGLSRQSPEMLPNEHELNMLRVNLPNL